MRRLIVSYLFLQGSSDSGKGNSTVNAFSQSNSPSSPQLHGNHVYQGGPQGIDVVHQFELPSDLVGRLIGKKGFTIKDIKAKSRANIQVYLHPFSEEMRLCTIEGKCCFSSMSGERDR